MKPGETIRFACGDCHIVFDITFAPSSEWAEDYGDGYTDGLDLTPTV